jgi:hypothetical protein
MDSVYAKIVQMLGVFWEDSPHHTNASALIELTVLPRF